MLCESERLWGVKSPRHVLTGAPAAGGMSAPRRPRRTRLLPRFCVCGAALLATIWVILFNGITGMGTAFTIPPIILTRYKKNEPPKTLTFINNWTKNVSYAHILVKAKLWYKRRMMSVYGCHLICLQAPPESLGIPTFPCLKEKSASKKKITRLAALPDLVT